MLFLYALHQLQKLFIKGKREYHKTLRLIAWVIMKLIAYVNTLDFEIPMDNKGANISRTKPPQS